MNRKPSQSSTEPISDPFGLGIYAATHDPKRDDHHAQSVSHEDFTVNPLWMITAGLAAFLILLVAVW